MPLNYLDDPKEFANYQLVAEIGEGPMGTVYKAKSRGVEGFEKTFCVKVISPQLATREEFVESLIEEAKQAVDLSHANVAQVHDLGQEESEGTFYIASEYVNGLDLGYALEVADAVDRDWPGDLSIYIASEIAQALDYAHQQKDFNFNSLDLVHRDLRPTNVLISYDGEVNVTDFGIAGALETLPTDDHPAPFRKFEYAAPEWARGEEYTQKSDIYSLGLIIYEMLAGEHPFELSDAPLRRAAAHAEYPPISETVDIPQKVRNTVEGMLHPRPDARIARASTVYEELIGYLYENDLRADNRALSALMDELRQNEQAVADQREGSEAGVEELTASEVSDFYDKSSATLSRDITDLKEAAESQGGGDPTAELDLSEIDLPVDGDPELPGGLENAYASARAGEGRVVLLSGQFGRGPEYLPDRLVEVLGLRQEARVFDVQTNADDEFRPFGAVADLLLTSAGGSADRSDRHEAALTTLAHRGTSQSARDLLRELWGLPRPAPSGDNARRVSDLTETLIDELAGRAGEGPVGIVIDGVERLDPESIDVLRELVAEIDRLPVLMILATHADERMRETFDVGSPDALKPMRVSSEDGTLAPELPEDLSATAEDLLLVLALAERPLPIDEAAAVLGADSDRIQTASDELMEAKLVRSPRPGVMMADFAEGSLWSRRHFDPDRVESVARALAGLFADRRPTDGPTLLDPAVGDVSLQGLHV
ncbi:MAG: serine/threonine protein kinase, partial [Bradymonadaceae bacterium]